METLVVYDSKFGNTQKIAETIAEAIKPYSAVQLYGVDTLVPDKLGAVDLCIVGGPTQAHGISARMRQFTDGLETAAGLGIVAATFDTRFRMPAAISGSAAKTIAKRLKRAGMHVCTPPQSFFVTRGGTPQLEAGEAERAAAWATKLVMHWATVQWCAA
jgi:flavodoxin I